MELLPIGYQPILISRSHWVRLGRHRLHPFVGAPYCFMGPFPATTIMSRRDGLAREWYRSIIFFVLVKVNQLSGSILNPF